MCLGSILLGSCQQGRYDPARAAQPYPRELHSTNTVDMQVFRRDTQIEIVNSTPISYSDFDLWINQQFVRHVDALPAGQTIRLSLWDFYDENGDQFNAGGFFRAYEPMPVRLVQIQPKNDGPLTGLITIRREEVRVAPDPGR